MMADEITRPTAPRSRRSPVSLRPKWRSTVSGTITPRKAAVAKGGPIRGPHVIDRGLRRDDKLLVQFRLPFKVPLDTAAISEGAIGAHDILQIGAQDLLLGQIVERIGRAEGVPSGIIAWQSCVGVPSLRAAKSLRGVA